MSHKVTVLRTMGMADALSAGVQFAVPPTQGTSSQWVYEVRFETDGISYPPSWVDHAILTQYIQAGYTPTNMLIMTEVPAEFVQESHIQYTSEVGVVSDKRAGSTVIEQSQTKAPLTNEGKGTATRREADDGIGTQLDNSVETITPAALDWGGSLGNEEREEYPSGRRYGKGSKQPFKLSERHIYFGRDDGRVLTRKMSRRLAESRSHADVAISLLYPLLPYTMQSAMRAFGGSQNGQPRRKFVTFQNCPRILGVDITLVHAGSAYERRMMDMDYRRWADSWGKCRRSVHIFESWFVDRGKANIPVQVFVHGVTRTLNVPVFSVLSAMLTSSAEYKDFKGNLVLPKDVQMYNLTYREFTNMLHKSLGQGDAYKVTGGLSEDEYNQSLTKKRINGVSKDFLLGFHRERPNRLHRERPNPNFPLAEDDLAAELLWNMQNLVERLGEEQPNSGPEIDALVDAFYETALAYWTNGPIKKFQTNGIISYDRLIDLVPQNRSRFPLNSEVSNYRVLKVIKKVLQKLSRQTLLFNAGADITSAMENVLNAAYGASALYSARIRLHLLYNAMSKGKYNHIQEMLTYAGRSGAATGDLLNPETITDVREWLLHADTGQPIEAYGDYIRDVQTDAGHMFVSLNDIIILNEILDILAEHFANEGSQQFKHIKNVMEHPEQGLRAPARYRYYADNQAGTEGFTKVKKWLKKEMRINAGQTLHPSTENTCRPLDTESVYCRSVRQDSATLQKYSEYIEKLFDRHSMMFE